jgi:hypothetical protein
VRQVIHDQHLDTRAAEGIDQRGSDKAGSTGHDSSHGHKLESLDAGRGLVSPNGNHVRVRDTLIHESGPGPADAEFRAIYSHARTRDPAGLLGFFAPDGTYTGRRHGHHLHGSRGHCAIPSVHAQFAPDSLIQFGVRGGSGGRRYLA